MYSYARSVVNPDFGFITHKESGTKMEVTIEDDMPSYGGRWMMFDMDQTVGVVTDIEQFMRFMATVSDEQEATCYLTSVDTSLVDKFTCVGFVPLASNIMLKPGENLVLTQDMLFDTSQV